MTLIEVRLDSFCERLARENRCLLALLRLGYRLAAAEALLATARVARGSPPKQREPSRSQATGAIAND